MEREREILCRLKYSTHNTRVVPPKMVQFLTAILTVKTPPLDSITFLICSRTSLSFVRPSARSNVLVVMTYSGGAIKFIYNETRQLYHLANN